MAKYGGTAHWARLASEESDLSLMDSKRRDLLAQSDQAGGMNLSATSLASVLEDEPAPDSDLRLWRYFLLAALKRMALETLLASRTTGCFFAFFI